MSKAIDILNAAVAELSTPQIADVTIARHRTWAVPSQKDGAAINVKLGRKYPPALRTGVEVSQGVADRTIELLVVIIARGDNALETVESLASEVNRRMFIDATLGGRCFDIEEAGALRDDADADGKAQMLTLVYRIRYRTIGAET
jgi:hypothetical protein